MVVKEHNRGCTPGNRFTKDFPRMSDCRVERSRRYEFDLKKSVLGVEHDDAELLDRARSVLRQQVRRQLTWCVQLGPVGMRSDQGSTPEFDGGEHLRSARPADAGDLPKVTSAGTRQAVQSATPLEHEIRERQHIMPSRPAAQYERQQFVVAKGRRPQALQLFTWPIVRRYLFHVYTRTLMHVRLPRAWVLALVLLTACGSPPNKEMDQAQGAIDAARAAGADRYAVDEYNSAVRTLELSTEAVNQGDYRLALNRAIESREHAQTAARQAAETRARLRGEVERAMADVTALLARAQERLAAAEKSRVTRRVITDAQRVLAAASDDVQKAGAAMQAEDYAAAEKGLTGARQRIAQVLNRLDSSLRAQNARRRR